MYMRILLMHLNNKESQNYKGAVRPKGLAETKTKNGCHYRL